MGFMYFYSARTLWQTQKVCHTENYYNFIDNNFVVLFGIIFFSSRGKVALHFFLSEKKMLPLFAKDS